MTLTMERKEAVLSVEDTIRKLQLLDARSKIWIQEVILKVDNKSITLIDCETMVSHTLSVVGLNINPPCRLMNSTSFSVWHMRLLTVVIYLPQSGIRSDEFIDSFKSDF